MANLPAYPHGPQVRAGNHRDWIAAQILGLLSLYYTPDLDPEAEAMMAKLWIDSLEPYSRDEIASAVSQWAASQTKRPTPADLRKSIIDARPRPRPVPMVSEAPRQRVTKEQAEAILKNNGFGHIVRRIERSGEE